MSRDFDARRGLALTAVSALLIVGASACGTDSASDDPVAADPTSAAPPSTATSSAAATDPSSPSASASSEDPVEPLDSPIVDKAARAAIEDGFPALVPSGLPTGWTVVKATYGPKGWRLAMTDANGAEVGVVQARGELAPLVAQVLGSGASRSGTVNLGQYGTGRWTAYAGGTRTGLGKVVAHTAAVIYAADQDTAVALGQQLLTAEDGDMEGG